jgi:hypothetical protein
MPRSPGTERALTLARYRRLILLGRVRLPLEEARRMVGPDCAYHLYFRHARESEARGPGDTATAPGRRARRRHK